MKRPEGFDRPAEPPAPAPRGRVATLTRPDPAPTAPTPEPENPARRARVSRASRAPSAKAELRAAGRARRREEKAEIRRFTRHARRRRVAVATTSSLALLLVAMILTAVYSPLLALRTIVVDGATRLDASQLRGAIDGQLGTPLALLDEKRIRAELGEFPLIRSYSTEIVPPDTLLVHVVERQPVAALEDGSRFELVDAAGVTVATSEARPDGVPLIVLPPSQGVDGPAFPAMTRVLLSIPADLLARVDTVTARTSDDVAFTLTGAAQKVKWGSAEDPAAKAQTLTHMPQWMAAQPGTYDVASSATATFTAG